MLRKLLAASAILVGTTIGAASMPAAPVSPGIATDPPVTLVKGGHGRGHGWHGNRGRHLGWSRGRHRGWAKHRRHRW